MNEERLPKKPSLGSVVRKRLSDITNSQQHLKSPNQDEKPRPIQSTTKEYIEQLHKENMALMRLLAERNKIIELTGVELTKMRLNLQKVQQQNWQLAQANSQMLAELNLGKDRLKAMHHELGCRGAVLAVKDMELQEKVEKKPCPKPCTVKPILKHEEVKGEAVQDNGDDETCNLNRRRQSRNQSAGSSAVKEQVAAKEKIDDKRKSARVKSDQQEPTCEKSDNKRLCLRRQSARFKSEQVEPTEDLFEIDAKFPASPLLDEKPDGATSSTTKEAKEAKIDLKCDTPALRRSSIGRPMRRAAEKVHSYKEVPVNVKMRRAM